MIEIDVPPGYRARPARPDDAEAVVALMNAAQLADLGATETTLDDLLADWHGVDLATEALAIEADGGGLAAYADLWHRHHLVVSAYGVVAPAHRRRGLGSALIAWGEAWARAGLAEAPAGFRVCVQHYVPRANEAAGALLRRHGYEAVRRIFEMTIDLPDEPPAPARPPGLRSRAFVPQADDRATFEAVEDAFRDLWGRTPGTLEQFVERTTAPGFDPELWRLAVDGDEIAGVALARVVGGEGWVDSLGVRRPWRRRGLGLALLRDAFRLLHDRGVRRVGLSVDAESETGAPNLYLRAGMAVKRSYLLYRKEIRPGLDPTVEPIPG